MDMVSHNFSIRVTVGYYNSAMYPSCTGGKNMSEPKMYINWSQMEKIVQLLALRIGEREYKRVIGISRGGLIPGVMISQMLDIPFTALQWQTRDGSDKDVPTLLNLEENVDELIFVDDICDSGLTIQQIKEYMPASQWAVLYDKIGTMELDFVGKTLYNNTQWLVFPWEKK
jgi:hypoxanthine phosphoribosyltransferase|tara:strand:- start:2156 stop:2668 length:513 start_codon:yes stop_codon:yes gene_type:complete